MPPKPPTRSRRQPRSAWSPLLAAAALGFHCLTAGAPAESDATLPGRPNRLVMMKADGLPPDLLAATAMPEREDLMARLSYAEDLKKAIEQYRERTGREFVLPNIRKFFYEDGVVFDNMYSHTLTLSAVAWAIIDTGQPSIVKGHGTFSRDSCYVRSHLDGFRDIIDHMLRAPGWGKQKTSATWVLDQAGASLMLDAFEPMRAWSGTQVYRRIANQTLLVEGGKQWLRAGGEDFGGIVRGHLSRQVTGLDYTEFNQRVNAEITARHILEPDLVGQERFDYLSPLFTLMDHQQHVDPHPLNLIHTLIGLDDAVGLIFRAVAQSDRRDHTVVTLVSDHGSEIKPGRVGFSLPLTRIFRDRLYGGHNVKTMLVESAWSAVSTPMPGIDWPRIYESDFSPYNRSGNPKHGEKGFTTAFIDPFGNGRAAVFLRNNDLNRLHLILLKLKENPKGKRFGELKRLFRSSLERTKGWLTPDLALLREYQEGAADLSGNLSQKADGWSKDTAIRLREEVKRNAPQIEALERLLAISFEPGQGGPSFDEIFTRPFEIAHYIPKEYLGVANSIRQLSRYSVGLDEEMRWVESTVDHKGNPVPMDYFEILSSYRPSVAPNEGPTNPYDFIVTAAPVAATHKKLVELGALSLDDRLRQAVWVKSTHRNHPFRGGEALIVERDDQQVLYTPIRGLREESDGGIEFSLATDLDPLQILKGPGFQPPKEASPLEWMRTFHSPQEWHEATHRTEYSIAVTILLDLAGDHAGPFIDNPDFQKYLTHFSSDDLKQRYLRGLKRKYATQFPDFLVWSDELWNFNSKARTSGGNHSGLRPIVTRTVFNVWGGDETGIARGRTEEGVSTTLDIVPTLFRALGMLDVENRVIRPRGVIDERVFLPFPGRVLPIWEKPPALPVGKARQ